MSKECRTCKWQRIVRYDETSFTYGRNVQFCSRPDAMRTTADERKYGKCTNYQLWMPKEKSAIKVMILLAVLCTLAWLIYGALFHGYLRIQ